MKNVRYYAEYLFLSNLIRLLALPRRSPTRTLGTALGRAVYATGVRRQDVLANLKTAFPEKSDGERSDLAIKCFEHLGRVIVDTASVPKWTDEELRSRITLEGWHYLEEARAAGRGVIIATGHLGVPDLGGTRITMEGARVTAVYQGVKNPYVDKWIFTIRCQRGATVTKRGIGFRKVYDALKRNECVAILADQDAGRNGLFIPFFGRTASTMKGPAEFALRTGAPMLTCFGPVIDGNYAVKFEPIIPHSDVETMMREYNRRLEAAIRLWPEQYFWLHRRWKTLQ